MYLFHKCLSVTLFIPLDVMIFESGRYRKQFGIQRYREIQG